MATSLTPATFKARGPSFSAVDNAVVQSALDEAVRWLNELAWGGGYDDGVFYLAAHILSLIHI